MNALLRQLLTTARSRRLFPEPGRCVVAVSGGPDSVALIHALHELAGLLGLELIIAHVDHGLRGEEATADAVLVGEVAGRLGLPAEFGLRRVEAAAGESIEEAARNVRYAFLGDMARRHGASTIAVGHTADDQAETLLMRLMRGAGPCGLKAMTSLAPRAGAVVVRPLLDVERHLVRAYLSERGLAFRLDRTNRDLRLTRNRTRHVLVPLLASEYNPGVVTTLGRTAALMSEVDEYFCRLADELLDSGVLKSPATSPFGPAVRPARAAGIDESNRAAVPAPGIPGPACLVLDLRRLTTYDHIVQRYLLRQAMLRIRSDLRGMGFHHIDALLGLTEKAGRERRVELPGGLVGLREGSELSLWESNPMEGRVIPLTTLPLDGRIDLPDLGFAIEARLIKLPEAKADERVSGQRGTMARSAPGVGEDPRQAVFDRARLRLPLGIRSRQAGDRIVPFGMTAAKKVKDLLIDARVPRRLRPSVPLLVDGAGGPGERVLWVAGHRRSTHALIGPETDEIVEVLLSTSES